MITSLAEHKKRRDLLTPQSRHWYALTGTLSGTPIVGVHRTVSCKSKLPVLDWTAAEAANLLFVSVTYVFFVLRELNHGPKAHARAHLTRILPRIFFLTKQYGFPRCDI